MEKESEEARQTLQKINQLNAAYAEEYRNATDEVTLQLKENNIYLIKDTETDNEQQMFIKEFYQKQLNCTTQPIWLNAISKLKNEEDNSIYLAVKMYKWAEEKKNPACNYAILKVPVQKFGRFLRLPDKDSKSYLMYLDDVVRLCMPWIFAGLNYTHFDAYSFKFTKDAEMEMDNDLNSGKMEKVQKGIKSRKKGEPLRVMYDIDMPKDLQKRLMRMFDMSKLDTAMTTGRYHNHKDFIKFPDCGRKDLRYPEREPLQLPEFDTNGSILEAIRKEDRFIHVPYHSFNAYLNFLREASIQPEVKSIKITLYRLAKESKVVETLIAAAKNKKKVTVVIELLARFDEANNIQWSKKMQDAGIEVVFGVEGLKIHSKLTLVETRRSCFACISTGNFHEGNAKIYTDCLLFTTNRLIIKDVMRVFDFINAPFTPVKFKELLVSPNGMKQQILQLINNEINNHRHGKKAYIQMKINHITDPDIIQALYAASKEGVEIDIVLRGNSSLLTGIKELSENIHIHGIIDRYLEHSRILLFCNGGDEKCYMGSADWMPRNLINRIEVMVPIYNAQIHQEMKLIVEYGLRDTQQGRIVDGSGRNEYWEPGEDEAPFHSQEALYKHYQELLHQELLHQELQNKNQIPNTK